MNDSQVDNSFPDTWYEEKQVILGSSLGLPDRKRMLEHVIADVVFRLLGEPGANPVGLAVTVHLAEGGSGDLEVVGLAPQYSETLQSP